MKTHKNRTAKSYESQSAMEYLMTYGWAILIIAVAVGALFSLGVFSGSNLLGSACTAQPGFLCQNPIYNHTTSEITVQLGQDNTQWLSADFIFVPEVTPLNSAGIPVVSGYDAVSEFTSPVSGNQIGTFTPGQTVEVTLPVNASNGYGGTINVGIPATGTVWAYYKTSATTQYRYVQVASINIKST